MDIRQLRTFIHVAELGRFSLAARRLHVAQPALSRQIRLLEEELNAQLLYRSSTGVTLTPAGQTLLGHARAILRQIDKARSEIAENSATVSGHVVFGMPQSAGVILAVSLIHRIRDRHPGITLQMIEGIGSMVHDWMLDGRLDVAVIYDVPPSSRITVQPLWSEDLHVVGPPDAFSGRPTVPLAEVAGLDLALPAMGNGLRGLAENWANRAGLSLRTVVEADAQRIQKELAMLGAACTILPRASVEAEIRAGTLSAARIVEPCIPRTLVLALPGDRPATPAARLLGSMILDLARELVADPTRPDLLPPAAAQLSPKSEAEEQNDID